MIRHFVNTTAFANPIYITFNLAEGAAMFGDNHMNLISCENCEMPLSAYEQWANGVATKGAKEGWVEKTPLLLTEGNRVDGAEWELEMDRKAAGIYGRRDNMFL